RGAESQGGFALVARNSEEHLARHRDDVRNHHNGEHDACGQVADAERRTLEQRQAAESALQTWLNGLAHQRDNDEDAEKAINDAGNGSQKIDEELQSVGDLWRREFREKNGRADTERDGNQEGDDGSEQSAINEGPGAKAVSVGVPKGSVQKGKAKLV